MLQELRQLVGPRVLGYFAAAGQGSVFPRTSDLESELGPPLALHAYALYLQLPFFYFFLVLDSLTPLKN